MANQITMSWSECKIEIGKVNADGTAATILESIGTIKDQSTNLETADGEELVARATGGKVVARELLEGEVTLTTRLIEPEYEFLAKILNAELSTDKKKLIVKSQIVNDYFTVKVTPKNIGATGILIEKASLVYKDGYSEEEGTFGDLTFTILDDSKGNLYTKFKKEDESAGGGGA